MKENNKGEYDATANYKDNDDLPVAWPGLGEPGSEGVQVVAVPQVPLPVGRRVTRLVPVVFVVVVIVPALTTVAIVKHIGRLLNYHLWHLHCSWN